MTTRKNILVICATSGIGQSIAMNLAPNSNLILIGRNIAKLTKLQSDLSNNNKVDVDLISVDFNYPKDFEKIDSYISAKQIRLDGIVVITPRPSLDSDLLPSEESWLAMFRLCFTSPLEILKLFLPSLNSPASVVIISGISSKQLMEKHASYGVLRAMWLSEAKGLSYRLGEKGITVNTVSPGGVLTDTMKNNIQKRAELSQLSFQDQVKKETDNIPLKKYAVPGEIASTVAFLLSEAASHISGANIPVDGGFVKTY